MSRAIVIDPRALPTEQQCALVHAQLGTLCSYEFAARRRMRTRGAAPASPRGTVYTLTLAGWEALP